MSEPLTFFDYQDDAHRRSRWAILGFVVTVVATVATVSLITVLLMALLVEDLGGMGYRELRNVVCAVAGITFGIILLSAVWRLLQLSAGPTAVMKSLFGVRVLPDTEDSDERRLLNLVEEMSIASGIPVPDVYLLRSDSINAFVTGLEIDQAAIGLTRGALFRLSRDELQGVIAHEFSHILNGDMALNTQMVAWLAGLFTVSDLGRKFAYLLGDPEDRDQISLPGLALSSIGIGIWFMGFIGVLFGKLLQARLSQQREYLADASAVQFTRNPEGLGNALRKLGARAVRGRMAYGPSDCDHLMFSPLRSSRFSGPMATHPPLNERIQRILPDWDGSYLQTKSIEPQEGVITFDYTVPPPLREVPTLELLTSMMNSLEIPAMNGCTPPWPGQNPSLQNSERPLRIPPVLRR